MFQYAAVRAFAEEWNAFLIVPSESLLRCAFVFSNKTIFLDTLTVKKIWRNENNKFSSRTFRVNTFIFFIVCFD